MVPRTLVPENVSLDVLIAEYTVVIDFVEQAGNVIKARGRSSGRRECAVAHLVGPALSQAGSESSAK